VDKGRGGRSVDQKALVGVVGAGGA